MFNMPIIVRHLPDTSSTTSTKLTTVTVIDANPIITRSDMNMATDVEKAKIPPVPQSDRKRAKTREADSERGHEGVRWECQVQGQARK